jgi:hypothetical protein
MIPILLVHFLIISLILELPVHFMIISLIQGLPVNFQIISLPLLQLLLNGAPLASVKIVVCVPKYSKDRYVHVAVNKNAKI